MDDTEYSKDLYPVHAPVVPRFAVTPLCRVVCKCGLLCGIICWLVCVSVTRNAAKQMRGSVGVLPPLEIGAFFAIFVFALLK